MIKKCSLSFSQLPSKELRFAFGQNWKRYIKNLGETEINHAKQSLSGVCQGLDLPQASFLDIGSGSGLFSYAAHSLGFGRVLSFDYDPHSVEATQAMRQRAGDDERGWKVMQGSVLDAPFMQSLGLHDLVYSWGVLHHTGDMWQAIDSAARAVKPGGTLFIALYNDQGWISQYWTLIKRGYVSSPRVIRLLMLCLFWGYFGMTLFIADLVRLRNPFKRYTGDRRGMKFFTDVIDWVGGYPFEVAAPCKVFNFRDC
jgi:2-polyprenyl-3-methyl-5-hydroxy-6-metoxy-1,4-benzoquinol methylase